jgi:peptidoglycan/xylan/chitin deacetylase (PgdA/CDA1 family)
MKRSSNKQFIVIAFATMCALFIITSIRPFSSTPTIVFGQSDDDDRNTKHDDTSPSNNDNEWDGDDNEREKNIYNDHENNRFVILTFDGGYKSHFTAVKPILDKYGFKATFYVVCNYAQKAAMDNTSDRMNWNEITELHKEAHDIGSNTMSHIRLHNIPVERIQYEVGVSRQCLLTHGINATSFAYPFGKGTTTEAVISTVANYYDIARTAGAPLMFLDCNGGKKNNGYGTDITDSNKNDNDYYHDIAITMAPKISEEGCSPFSADGGLNPVSRYSLKSWSHDSERKDNLYNQSEMFKKFVETVDGQDKYNNDSDGDDEDDRVNTVKAIPIITWNNIINSTAKEEGQSQLVGNIEQHPYTTTSIDLFEEEIKYLYDNGFKVITMADLAYDENTNNLNIKDASSLVTPLVNYGNDEEDDDSNNEKNDEDGNAPMHNDNEV